MDTRSMIGLGKVSRILSDGTWAYKTYPPGYPTEWIKREDMIHHELASKTDLPVPRCTYIAGTRELRMTLIDGKTLADMIRKDKYKNGLEDLVSLQISTYRFDIPALEDAFSAYASVLLHSGLEPEIKNKALECLEGIKRIRVLCHLDFHFENIMSDGTSYHIIDWVNAMRANPVMDIARTYVILRQHAPRMASKYVTMITKEMNIPSGSVYDAVPLMAALRMIEDDTETFTHTLREMVIETSG